jgi:hypothetical protein
MPLTTSDKAVRVRAIEGGTSPGDFEAFATQLGGGGAAQNVTPPQKPVSPILPTLVLFILSADVRLAAYLLGRSRRVPHRNRATTYHRGERQSPEKESPSRTRRLGC